MKKWPKIKEQFSYKGRFVKILKRTFLLPDGKEKDTEIYFEQDTASVLALSKDQKVILARQFRPGIEQVLLELPGGMVDKGETPAQAIKREFLEETGHTGNFKFIGTAFQDAYSTRIRYHFIATNCQRIQDPQNTEEEFIEVVKLSLNDFKKHLRSGKLTDVQTGYMGLEYLDLL